MSLTVSRILLAFITCWQESQRGNLHGYNPWKEFIAKPTSEDPGGAYALTYAHSLYEPNFGRHGGTATTGSW